MLLKITRLLVNVPLDDNSSLVQKLKQEIVKKDQLIQERASHQKEIKTKEEIIEQILEDCQRRLREKEESPLFL